MILLLAACVLLAIILAVISVAYPPLGHQLLIGAVLFLALAVILLSVRLGIF